MIDSLRVAADEVVWRLENEGLPRQHAEWLALEYLTWLIDGEHRTEALLASIKRWLTEEGAR